MSIKEVSGVLIVKDGKAWGTLWGGSSCTSMGWVDIGKAQIFSSECCRKVTDATYANSPYIEELLTGKLVKVKRTTTITTEIIE